MATRSLGLIMHGVTGRMGMNQHLIRSIFAIRAEGGVLLADGDRVMPDPILIGRNAGEDRGARQGARHRALGHRPRRRRSPTRATRSSSTPPRRRCGRQLLAQGAAAGKHVYCEKPIATNLAEAIEVSRLAQATGVKHGAVQDKLFLPGLRKLDMLRRRRLLRPHAVAAPRVRLLGVRGRPGSRSSGRRGTTAPRTAAA